ncbi:hypothetical protein H1R20_g523, partial [Candolleomyces eurysporus]
MALPLPLASSASPCVVEDQEAFTYFYGQHSRPKLIARSDSSTRPWATIEGGRGWPRKRYLANVGYHERLASFWLSSSKREMLVELLDSMSVEFTTIDPVRIIEQEAFDYYDRKTTVGHRALAIAIKPDTLSLEKGVEVVVACKTLLHQHGIDDIECLVREAECFSSAGPVKFQVPAPYEYLWGAHIRVPATSTLGTSIATASTPGTGGTRGFYVASENSGKLYFLTCRHVVLRCNSAEENVEYRYTGPSKPRIGVIQPSPASSKRTRERAEEKIKDLKEHPERNRSSQMIMEELEGELAILKLWEGASDGVIGHVVYSPPLIPSAASQEYTLDVAVCEIDPSLLDTKNFFGNVVDWGSPLDFCLSHHGFTLSSDRLQRLEGLVSVDEIVKLKSKSLSTSGEDIGCLVVSKRGAASGVTFGKANNLPSLRTYEFVGGPAGTGEKCRGLEWGIFRYDHKRETKEFSECGGDSGATVFDNQGRIFGLLTGWSGKEEKVDITYAMPAELAVNEISKRWEKVHTNVLEGESVGMPVAYFFVDHP